MSLNEHNRVLEALDVLCNISKETLRSLRTQVPLAFQKLQALVANSSHPQDTNRFSPSLETQSLPIPCSHSQTSTSDVSNITDTSSATLVKYRRFRVVKYEDLDSLVRGMKQTGWIMELAEKKADWLDGCQNQYDGMYSVLELAPLNFVQHGAEHCPRFHLLSFVA